MPTLHFTLKKQNQLWSRLRIDVPVIHFAEQQRTTQISTYAKHVLLFIGIIHTGFNLVLGRG